MDVKNAHASESIYVLWCYRAHGLLCVRAAFRCSYNSLSKMAKNGPQMCPRFPPSQSAALLSSLAGGQTRCPSNTLPFLLSSVAIFWLEPLRMKTPCRRKLLGIRIGLGQLSLLVIPDLFVHYNGRTGEEETSESLGQGLQ